MCLYVMIIYWFLGYILLTGHLLLLSSHLFSARFFFLWSLRQEVEQVQQCSVFSTLNLIDFVNEAHQFICDLNEPSKAFWLLLVFFVAVNLMEKRSSICCCVHLSFVRNKVTGYFEILR